MYIYKVSLRLIDLMNYQKVSFSKQMLKNDEPRGLVVRVCDY